MTSFCRVRVLVKVILASVKLSECGSVSEIR